MHACVRVGSGGFELRYASEAKMKTKQNSIIGYTLTIDYGKSAKVASLLIHKKLYILISGSLVDGVYW